jgi:hypothetical protein
MTDVKKAEGPKVFKEDIQAILSACKFEVDQAEGRTATHVHVYDEQGYYLGSGFSACVDPANFDAKLGQEYALNNAIGKAEGMLWQLEGYHLKKELEAGRYILTQEDKQQPFHIQRVICERNDLMRNFSLLTRFVEQGCPGVQDTAEVELLREQAGLQLALVQHLDKRLALVGLS